MKAINTLLWHIALILALVWLGFPMGAMFAAGFSVGFWFCVVNLALYFGRMKDE
jgi:hypothetical protein